MFTYADLIILLTQEEEHNQFFRQLTVEYLVRSIHFVHFIHSYTVVNNTTKDCIIDVKDAFYSVKTS